MEPSGSAIYFTAQFYRHNKVKPGTLDALGPSHLWRIEPDGSGLCRVGKTVPRAPFPVIGKQVAEDFPTQTVVFLDANGRKLAQAKDLIDWVLSPDAKWVYLVTEAGDGAFLELATGQKRRAPLLYNANWLPDGSLWGDTLADFEGEFTLCRLRLGQAKGESWLLRPEREQQWVPGVTANGGRRFRRWFLLPQNPHQLIAETEGHMSDGPHLNCVLCDLDKRTWRPLSRGRLVGISPDGRSIATAREEWIGEYKRGGARCGPLEIVTLATGKKRTLTTELVSIADGYWRALGEARANTGRRTSADE